MVLLMGSKKYSDIRPIQPPRPHMHITILVTYAVRGRRLSPLSLNFFISAFHGPHVDPYFLSSRVSSSRCSFCKHMEKCKNFSGRSVLEAGEGGEGGGKNEEHLQGSGAPRHRTHRKRLLSAHDVLGSLHA